MVVAGYARFLREALNDASLPEKKMFFKTFIRAIKVTPSEVTIEYIAPILVEGVPEAFRYEVLSLDGTGGSCWIRTSDLGIKSPLLYQLS